MRFANTLSFLLITATAACDPGVGIAAAQTAPEAARVDMRRVWRGSDVSFYVAAPSPDGRSVSDVDWTTGDLAIVDFATGERRRVTDKGPWSVAVDYAEHSVFAPDGQRLAYSWFREGSGYQLRIIDVAGTDERIVVPHSEDLRYIAAEDWSPDGRQILVTVFRRDRSSQIATVSAETGELRVLKTSDWRHPVVSAFSRDSRFIAYDFQPDEEDRQRDIFALRADGSGRETRVVGGPSDDILLGWLPDGSGILFYSDRHQTRGIWKQPIRDGRAEGEPLLVRPAVWQLTPLGFSRDAYFYGVHVRSPQVYTMTVDQTANRVVVDPAAVQDPSAGQTGFGAWSADGRYFAYLRELPDFSDALVIRSVDGADAREVRVDLDDPRHIQWHPDGRSMLMVGTDPEGRIGIHRVDIRTGDVTLVVQRAEAEPSDLGRFRLSPDGGSILYWKQLDPSQRGAHKDARMALRDLATGEETLIHEVLNPGPAFFSPDGSMYVKMDWNPDTRLHSLFVARTDGAAGRRTIYETEHALLQNRGGFPFTPDGRHVIAAEHRRDPEEVRLLKIPVDGGDPIVLLTWTEGRMVDLRMSPDGRRISFGSGDRLVEIWAMENLGPAGSAAESGGQ